MSNNITQITGNITSQVVFDVNSVKGLTDDANVKVQSTKGQTITAKWVKVTLAVLIVAVALLTLSVCNYYWCHFRIDGDSAGAIISALAILVTFLVGWNIWQTIDAKNSIKEFEKRAENLEADLQSKIDELKAEEQRDFNTKFERHNFEIRLFVEAHFKLLNIKDDNDLSDRYISYADALLLFLRSNVDLSYEKVDAACEGITLTMISFLATNDILVAADFIDREKEYERLYREITTSLSQRERKDDNFYQKLARMRDYRINNIKQVKDSDLGKAIQRHKQEQKDYEKELRQRVEKREQ